jgi:hypothetical protein
VDLESVIVATFVWIDETLTAGQAETRPLRSRGPAPRRADSEVLTMEVVGEFLGIDCDRAILAYFQRHHAALFPRITQVHRTTRHWRSLTASRSRCAASPMPRPATAGAPKPPSGGTPPVGASSTGCACTCGCSGRGGDRGEGRPRQSL